MTADQLIKSLRLAPHPEGGFFRETYRAAGTIAGNALPNGFAGDRVFSTSIYYLLQGSRFRRCTGSGRTSCGTFTWATRWS